ncbi:MAG: VanZ family protein [Candidatus Tectomicrobia bacterium]|nr:VanZ family protein [Candidatus Tectomicrobia bacterium]
MKAWLLIASYVAAIFATMPYQPRLVYAFHGPYANLFAPLMLAIFGLVAAALLGYTVRLHRRLRVTSIFCLAVAGAAAWVVSRHLEAPVEKIHLIEYGALSVLLYRRFAHHFPAAPAKALILAVAAASLIGIGDEFYQLYLPSRYFGWFDMVTNLIGVFLGLVIWFGVLRPPAPSAGMAPAPAPLLVASPSLPLDGAPQVSPAASRPNVS